MTLCSIFFEQNAGGSPIAAALGTKTRPDDFGIATNAILPGYALLQRLDINVVHLPLWLWRKQQIRDKQNRKWVMLPSNQQFSALAPLHGRLEPALSAL